MINKRAKISRIFSRALTHAPAPLPASAPLLAPAHVLAFALALLFVATAIAGAARPAAPLYAADADPYNSRAYIVVDTALADSRDYVELEVVLVAEGGGLVTDKRVFCASSRKEDSIAVGANDGGILTISISSSLPGVSRIALSLVSQDAAARFLSGETGYDDAKIVQTDKGLEIFSVYFIAGSLDIDSCEIEFDRDTIAVTDGRYSDNAIGTVRLRTEIDQPVANKRFTVYTKKSGIVLYPTISSAGNTGQGPSITLTTDKDGEVSFVVRGYEIGDAEIICSVDGAEFSEFIYVDTAENVFEFEDPYWDDEDEEDEEEKPVISLEHTRVDISKIIAYEHGSNGRYGLSTEEDGWDTIIIGGVAMSDDDQPVREQHLVNAWVTAGTIDKNTTLTTSNGGAFAFSLTSKEVCMGRYAVGLGTVDQLRGYLEGRVSAEACQLLRAGTFSFISHEWNQYMICGIDDYRAIVNGNEATLDVAPFIQNGRTMLTARPIAETIGATANWNQSTQTASFYVPRGNYTVSMKVGSLYIDRTEQYVAPRQYISDVPAIIRDGRTVLPLRALGESFAMQTIYDEAQKMVAVYNLRAVAYDPRLDPDSPLYDPTRDPDNELYIPR